MPNHRKALLLMLLVTLMWSMAGVVSRQFETVGKFEASFWRSAFTVLGTAVLLFATQGTRWISSLKSKWLWASGACWAVMFTAFMLAFTLTTVANVLITMSLAPLATAILSRLWLKRPLAARTAWAIAAAVLGIGVMYGGDVSALTGKHGLGVVIAMGIPLAAAVNWTLAAHSASLANPAGSDSVDLIPAVLLGALISSMATLAFALPFTASSSDIGWLATLGFFQLAVPCMIVVWCARHLPPAELSLLCLLEILFGVAWVWLAGEQPSASVLLGGSIVLAALVINEIVGLKQTQTAGKIA